MVVSSSIDWKWLNTPFTQLIMLAGADGHIQIISTQHRGNMVKMCAIWLSINQLLNGQIMATYSFHAIVNWIVKILWRCDKRLPESGPLNALSNGNLTDSFHSFLCSYSDHCFKWILNVPEERASLRLQNPKINEWKKEKWKKIRSQHKRSKRHILNVKARGIRLFGWKMEWKWTLYLKIHQISDFSHAYCCSQIARMMLYLVYV